MLHFYLSLTARTENHELRLFVKIIASNVRVPSHSILHVYQAPVKPEGKTCLIENSLWTVLRE
jgi:hypothetical protein